ncbi:MAG: thioredoxin family protein [Pedobacter sp.]|uniref:thioredoxin family protein n=1 Tax=Pedobacter sp. TaxID=1411316 RepID=UPI00356258F4
MNDSNTFKDIERPVLLQFSAAWCGPCKMLAPIINQVEQKIKEIADVRRLDVDQESSLSVEFSVRSVPTLILLSKGGSIYWRHTGLISEKELMQKIESLI